MRHRNSRVKTCSNAIGQQRLILAALKTFTRERTLLYWFSFGGQVGLVDGWLLQT